MFRAALLTIALGWMGAALAAEGPVAAVPRDALVLVELCNGPECYRQAFTLDAVRHVAATEAGLALGRLVEGAARLGALYLADAPLSELAEMALSSAALAVMETPEADGRAGWVVAADLADRGPAFDRMWQERTLAHLKALPHVKVEPLSLETPAHRIEVRPGRHVVVARPGPYLLVGSEKALAAAAAVVAGKQPSLASMPDFARHAAALRPAAGVWLWMNVEALRRRAETEGPPSPRKARDMRNMGLDKVRFYASSAVVRDGLVEERAAADLAPEPAGLLGLLATVEPRAVQAPAAIPAGYDAYAAITFKDGPEIQRKFEEFLRIAEGEQAVARWRNGLADARDKLQVDVEADVVRSLGREAFLALRLDVPPDGQPAALSWSSLRWIAGAHCRDASRIVQKANLVFTADWAQQAGVQWNIRNVGDTAVYQLGFQANPMASPSYAQVGDMIMFSMNHRTLAEAVQARQAGNGLRGDAALSRVAGEQSPAALEVAVKLQPALAALIESGRSQAKAEARPWWHHIVEASRGLAAVHLRVTPAPSGLAIRCRSPLGLATVPVAVVAASEALKKPVPRKTEEAQDRGGQAVPRDAAGPQP